MTEADSVLLKRPSLAHPCTGRTSKPKSPCASEMPTMKSIGSGRSLQGSPLGTGILCSRIVGLILPFAFSAITQVHGFQPPVAVPVSAFTDIGRAQRSSLPSDVSVHKRTYHVSLSSLRDHETNSDISCDDTSTRKSIDNNIVTSSAHRRTFLGSAATTVASLITKPSVAFSADEATASSTEASAGMVSAASVGRRLRAVPTFAIVDRRGVPFMVFGEDAKLTAYFFTSYDEARRILDVAIISSDQSLADLRKETNDERRAEGLKPLTRKEQDDELGINPWKEARISTVPMDFAVTLATKSGRQRGGAVYFRVSPSEDDVADALEVDSKLSGGGSKTDLAEGKVPLFYFEDFKISRSAAGIADDGELPDEVSPVYFSKAALLEAYNRSQGGTIKAGDELPEIKVSELLSVVTAMVDPGVKDEDLKSLVFVAPAGSSKRAKECEKRGGKEQPFIIGERIVAY